ncbi:MAG TPA: DnaB-like helicase N-terminal domain-containing protein, partial [Solirubrobacteraceae bacterium]|nr:DnaB-like helicase N-terminal domain-containing protein [Solirubrobacteraceae bacterium]
MIAEIDTTLQDAEFSAVGSVLLANGTLDVLAVEEGLRPEHFESTDRAGAYRAMLALADEGDPVDPLTLATHGVPRALIDTAAATALPTYARQHARLVVAEHRWRARRSATARQQQAIGDRD